MLEIKNLKFSYKTGDLIFDNVNLRLEKGCHFISGPNGCGKTTLMRILSNVVYNIYRCDISGEIYLNGKKDFNPVVVLQNLDSNILYDSAYDEVKFFSFSPSFTFKNPDDFFNYWNINNFKMKNTAKLSYGEKQRYLIAIALSFINKDKMICLDEPFAFLDDENVSYIKDLIKKLKKDSLILLFGHNISEVNDIVDFFWVIKNKKIVPMETNSLYSKLSKLLGSKRSQDIVLKCESVSHNYIRKKVSFEIRKGELKVLYAPNGSGKTTLVKILSGMINDYSGNIYINGKKADSFLLLKSVFCVLSNPDTQIIARTIRDFFEDDKFYINLLKKIGLDLKLNYYISHLSYGEKQKLLILYSLFKKKDLIIIDEPFMSFDCETETSILEFIEDYLKNGGSVIISTPKKNFFRGCDIIEL